MTGRQEISSLRLMVNCGRFENSHCGGWAMSTITSDTVFPSSHFARAGCEKMKPWDWNPEIANAEAPQTTSTSSPSMSASLPASSSVLPWSPTASCSGTPPGLSLPISTRTFSSGARGWRQKWQDQFQKNLQLTQYLQEIKWSPPAGLHSSQTFHGKARYYYDLVDLHSLFTNHLLFLIFDDFVCQQWRQHDNLRTCWGVELRNSSF